MESFRLSTAWSHSHGEVDYKTKSGTSWRHSHLNQKPWHPLSYPNQSRNWIAEQTNAQRERRAEEVAREIEMMKAVSFMYVRPPGYNAESAKAAEIADERKKEDLDDPFQKPLEAPPEASSTKSGTAWSHSYLNQKPWHPFSYPNQCRKWIAEQTNAQRESRAEEVVREYAQESVEAREDLDGDDEGEGLELQQQCYPREASNRDYIYEEMQDLIGSVPRPLVFKSTSRDDGRFGGFVEKIGSGSRKSQMVLFSKPPTLPTLPHSKKDDTPPIRWQKGELIGEGSFGKVYMGVNLDSGELLAVKQVLIAGNGASKKKTKARIRELEAEVELLKNLSHQNIVKYLGTVREDDSLNVLLELVPGGSISSILGKLGPFHESVIRRYTKQLLLGLEYLHKNEIMHRDIKGANILVDNEGCIKLADFGASKKVAEQCAKSFKGTICWMAPEVILQTGHSFSADIWSVGCTVIEMATGNPPWSQQYQEEMAVVHHIGKTKSHPHIPEHLSSEGKDFLLKCFEKEPDLRATASDLLQHPFVTGEYEKPCLVFHNSLRESINLLANEGLNIKNMINIGINNSSDDVCEMSNLRCSAYWNEANYDDDLCQIDDKNDFMVGGSNRLNSTFASADLNKSFNPMYEPNDDGSCKFGETPESDRGGGIFFSSRQEVNPMCEPSASIVYEKIQKKFDDADARLGVERRIADIGNQLTHLTQLMEAMRSQFDSWFTKQG
ncbi:mitogen-activated protein kinase kinase kinase 3-like isoform X2 [Euphorbia lathyris]|uniref:mitogen-activated protein kinase kinase kinase 3-like isoform X2 n=1 Tax=Euphorbia lathyris TaxID=212925 RepID=UPI003313E75B